MPIASKNSDNYFYMNVVLTVFRSEIERLFLILKLSVPKKFQICKKEEYILFVMEHFYKWGRWFGRFLFSINVKLHVLLILFLKEYESLSTSSLSSISLVYLYANSLKKIPFFSKAFPYPQVIIFMWPCYLWFLFPLGLLHPPVSGPYGLLPFPLHLLPLGPGFCPPLCPFLRSKQISRPQGSS